MKKKFQIAALCVVLLAVIGGGIWFLTGGSQTDGPDTPEDPHEAEDGPGTSGGGEAGAFDLANRKPTHFSIQERIDEIVLSPYVDYTSSIIHSYEGQFCQLTYKPGEAIGTFTVDVVAMRSGDVLHSFSSEDFPVSYTFEDDRGVVELGENFVGLTLDEGGDLWALYGILGDRCVTEFFVAPCKPDVSEGDVVFLGNLGTDRWEGPVKFLVWDGHAFIRDMPDHFSIADLSTGSYTKPAGDESVRDFCLDEEGNLYYVWGPDRNVDKYSLETGETIWSRQVGGLELPFFISVKLISYTPSGGLFIHGTSGPSDPGGIYWINLEAGETSQREMYHELINFDLDMNDLPQVIDSPTSASHFAVDNQYQIYFSDYSFYFLSEDYDEYLSQRSVYILEPEARDIDPESIVTLSITAPYEVESVGRAIEIYQRQHPEMEVVWDTQYSSREEYQKNALEYKEQIAVRTMTGDVGDLQMITGSGLTQDVITDTDAFLDLSSYLDGCPFREELSWNIIETLRGEDGAIRAVPLAARSSYYLWNTVLLEEQGNPVDPENTTWMELLDLALQWKDEKAGFSLMMGDDRQSTENDMLYDMLLANLYSAEQPDGTVQLDQPYLRELLEKWKELHGSTYLVDKNTYGENTREDVLMFRGNVSKGIGDAIYLLIASEQSSVGELLVAPTPRGEINKKQQGYAFCWGIPASSPKQEQAWELLEYLISSNGLPSYSYSDDTLITNTAAQAELFAYYNELAWENTGETEIAKKYFSQLCDLQKIPYSRLDEPYGWYDAVYVPIKAYIDGEMTLDEALETANDNWERFILE